MNDDSHKIDEQILSEFEAAWIAGNPLSIANCLVNVSEEYRAQTLIELVLIDIEFAWKNRSESGPTPRLLESYVEEFPELAQEKILQQLLEEEYRVRTKHGDKVSYEQFERRFSTIVEAVDFTEIAAENDVENGFQWSLQSGTVIDKFTLSKEIGQGGMGRVFVAHQSDPVKRQVALKVIKKGLNSKEVIARFEAERQALALMDHPNIARILDGGSTADGQPYFVMEYVKGQPLTDYCDAKRLGLNERLGLFVDICNAVQHAHQKGIIHRDLKPSNILVAEYDGVAVPKVIDFGLAKALDSQKLLTEQTLATHFGQVVGTFKYMSPEQADSETIDIDTRTDIYALGVILYELLTGKTPLDQQSFKDKALLKVLELIRDHEPQRPSTKLSSLEKAVTTVSEQRQTDPGRLSQILRGDLDWVVMKALDKERHRRYESASSFGDDIQRFLDSEPVLARPPSTAYKIRKFVGKNRGLVASVATIVVLLVGGIVGTSWFAIKANNAAKNELAQRKVAEEKEAEAVTQKNKADQAKDEAEASAKRANEVLKIVSGSFKSTNPNEGANADMTAKEVLINAQKSMETSELDDLGKIELLETLSTSFRGLGEKDLLLKTSQQQLNITKKNFGEDHLQTTNAMNNLGNGYFHNGQNDKALGLFEKVVEIRKEKLGMGNQDTLGSMMNLANALEGLGRLDEALTTREQVLAASREHFGGQHNATLTAINNLAASYSRKGDAKKASELINELVKGSEALFGADHPKTLTALQNLGIDYAKQGNFPKAIETLEIVNQRQAKKLGADHPDTLAGQAQLSTIYYVSGNLAKALELGEENLRLTREKLGNEHPETIFSMRNLANIYNRTGKKQRAIEIRSEAVEISKKIFGEAHPETLSAEMGLANLIDASGEKDKALKMRERLYRVMTEKLGAEHPETIKLMTGLAASYMENGRPNDGLELFEKIYEVRSKRLGDKHISTVRARQNVEMAREMIEKESDSNDKNEDDE